MHWSFRAAHITQDFLRELKIPLLRKPFALDDLLGTIDNALAIAPARRPALD